MSNAWFYAGGVALDVGLALALDPAEARHATGARRLSEESAITLFDGRGHVASARIQTVAHKGRDVTVIVESVRHEARPEPAIHLICSLPKGDRQSTLLSMATQLGMTSFTPLICRHTAVRPGDGFAHRARRILIEACKQSHQAHVPEVRPAVRLADVFHRGSACPPVLLAHPGGESLHGTVQGASESTTVLIGPEGGFDETEIALARSRGARIVALESAVLRIETAAVAIMAFLRLRSSLT